MFVSPVTLNTVILISSGTSLRLVNHSASAQDCKTAFAFALPALALSATSWNASNTSNVFSKLQQLSYLIQHHPEAQLKALRYSHQASYLVNKLHVL